MNHGKEFCLRWLVCLHCSVQHRSVATIRCWSLWRLKHGQKPLRHWLDCITGIIYCQINHKHVISVISVLCDMWMIYDGCMCVMFFWRNHFKLASAQTTMESLKPRNVARIPWSEVERQQGRACQVKRWRSQRSKKWYLLQNLLRDLS